MTLPLLAFAALMLLLTALLHAIDILRAPGVRTGMALLVAGPVVGVVVVAATS